MLCIGRADPNVRWYTQCKVSTHGYVRGAYVDKVCTDPSGNTTTKRVASSGLYE